MSIYTLQHKQLEASLTGLSTRLKMTMMMMMRGDYPCKDILMSALDFSCCIRAGAPSFGPAAMTGNCFFGLVSWELIGKKLATTT